MKIYILITDYNSSSIVSGVYSSKEALINDLTTKLSAETINHVELWELDKGFIDNVNITKQTLITIED